MSHTGSDVQGCVAILKDKQPLSVATIIDVFEDNIERAVPRLCSCTFHLHYFAQKC